MELLGFMSTMGTTEVLRPPPLLPSDAHSRNGLGVEVPTELWISWQSLFSHVGFGVPPCGPIWELQPPTRWFLTQPCWLPPSFPATLFNVSKLTFKAAIVP